MASTLRMEPPQRLVTAQGVAMAEWLSALPEVADEMLRRWRLTAERVTAPGGRTSMTVLVRDAEGAPAVLKLCLPGTAELEDAALRRWDGSAAVRPLRCAPEAGALLLERLRGETSLRSLPESKAVLEAVEVAHRLWVDPGGRHPFPTVADLTARQAEALRAAPAPGVALPSEAGPLVDEALSLREELLAGDGEVERLLLHGDFRQGAVLASDGDRAPWLAVGPEPVVGERAFDLARLARDRLHDLVASPGAAAMTRRRVTRLAGMAEVDAERLRAWSLFRAVASAARSLAEGRRVDAEMLLEFAAWL